MFPAGQIFAVKKLFPVIGLGVGELRNKNEEECYGKSVTMHVPPQNRTCYQNSALGRTERRRNYHRGTEGQRTRVRWSVPRRFGTFRADGLCVSVCLW